MASPALRDAGVAFDVEGVRGVDGVAELRRRFPEARVIELGEAAILPGLVNAHTHLELTLIGPPPSGGISKGPIRFVDWILELRSRAMRVVERESQTRQAVVEGVRQSLACGVTAVGDIAGDTHASRAALAGSVLKGVSFGEVLGMAGRAGQFEARLAAAIDRALERPGLMAGIEPHAPYSVDLVNYQRCIEAARDGSFPIATHLAETAEEAEFLADHSGEFARLWSALDAWTPGVSTFSGGAIRAMHSVGLLNLPAVLAHVNYVDDAEMELLAKGRASVVYCPRTHAYFGHPPHRFREMLERGINVALGTDSAVSSPDLNLLEELRWVRRIYPEIEARTLFEMVTMRAAAALGMSDRIGAIREDSAADFAVFRARSAEPLEEILESGESAMQTWVDGVRVV